MPQTLSDILITEISLVDASANKGARVVFFKRAGETQKEQKMATSKAEIHKLISELAEKHGEPGLSPAQRYVKFITRHPDGEKLYQCYKLASGPSYIPPAPVEVRKVSESEPLQKLNYLAAELHKLKPEKSIEQCFAEVYRDPCDGVRELVAAERAERLAKAAAAFAY
jgi:hypothetical protein